MKTLALRPSSKVRSERTWEARIVGERGAGRQSSRRSTFSVTPAAPSGAPALGALTGHAAFSRPSQRPPAQQAQCSQKSRGAMAGALHFFQASQRLSAGLAQDQHGTGLMQASRRRATPTATSCEAPVAAATRCTWYAMPEKP